MTYRPPFGVPGVLSSADVDQVARVAVEALEQIVGYMTEREQVGGPNWEYARGIAKLHQAHDLYLEALHDLETASRSSATSMAASVSVLLMNRVETLEKDVKRQAQLLEHLGQQVYALQRTIRTMDARHAPTANPDD